MIFYGFVNQYVCIIVIRYVKLINKQWKIIFKLLIDKNPFAFGIQWVEYDQFLEFVFNTYESWAKLPKGHFNKSYVF